MQDRIGIILFFLREIEKCKTVQRQIYCSDLARTESDAEHSWHLAMILILFQKELPNGLDFQKMLKMALMHDLVEIYAGDTFAFDAEGRKTKKEREMAAAEKLFSQLPDDLKKEFTDLFNEFEEEKTPEAKFVVSFDKIQPVLQNLCSGGKAWKEHNLTVSIVDEYKRKHMEHSSLTLDIYERLLEEGKNRGLI